MEWCRVMSGCWITGIRQAFVNVNACLRVDYFLLGAALPRPPPDLWPGTLLGKFGVLLMSFLQINLKNSVPGVEGCPGQDRIRPCIRWGKVSEKSRRESKKNAGHTPLGLGEMPAPQ